MVVGQRRSIFNSVCTESYLFTLRLPPPQRAIKNREFINITVHRKISREISSRYFENKSVVVINEWRNYRLVRYVVSSDVGDAMIASISQVRPANVFCIPNIVLTLLVASRRGLICDSRVVHDMTFDGMEINGC